MWKIFRFLMMYIELENGWKNIEWVKFIVVEVYVKFFDFMVYRFIIIILKWIVGFFIWVKLCIVNWEYNVLE